MIGAAARHYYHNLQCWTPNDPQLGARLLERTRIQRMTKRPFSSTRANNWMHIPLIQLILPNAKIIERAGHPMAAAFQLQTVMSRAYVQLRSDHLGHYYREYVRFMAHVDAGCLDESTAGA